MAAYRRVYDSRHLQADCQEPGSSPEPYARYYRVWATFTFYHLRVTAVVVVLLFDIMGHSAMMSFILVKFDSE